MNVKRTGGALLLAVLGTLTACGGDGGDGASTAESAVAGGWTGTSSVGGTVAAVILDDGSMWAIAGVASGDSFYPTELYQGRLTAGGGTLASSDLRGYDFASGGSASGTLSGSYTANTRIGATVTPTGSGSGVQVDLVPAAVSNYDYAQPARLDSVAGSWSGFFSSDETGTIQVQSNGSFGTVTSLGCSITGKLTPDISGKNVFSVSATFGPAPCQLANATMGGIAVVTGSGASAEITIGVTTPDRAYGGAYFGHR
jgi:hypothetical protein